MHVYVCTYIHTVCMTHNARTHFFMKAANVSDSGAHCSSTSKHSSSWVSSESEEAVLPDKERTEDMLWADLLRLLPLLRVLGRLQRSVAGLREAGVSLGEESVDTVK